MQHPPRGNSPTQTHARGKTHAEWETYTLSHDFIVLPQRDHSAQSLSWYKQTGKVEEERKEKRSKRCNLSHSNVED